MAEIKRQFGIEFQKQKCSLEQNCGDEKVCWDRTAEEKSVWNRSSETKECSEYNCRDENDIQNTTAQMKRWFRMELQK